MTHVLTQNSSNLFFCNAEEYERLKANNIPVSALLCAKHPYHKEIVGYTQNCPKEHVEYLFAYRHDQHILALNMVDANDPKYFADEMIEAGVNFIESELACNRDVVVVCNKGESRSPTMCLMYMMKKGIFDYSKSHSEVFEIFRKIAPEWKPKNGILFYCINYWNHVKERE